jgi:hypothetical protein
VIARIDIADDGQQIAYVADLILDGQIIHRDVSRIILEPLRGEVERAANLQAVLGDGPFMLNIPGSG